MIRPAAWVSNPMAAMRSKERANVAAEDRCPGCRTRRDDRVLRDSRCGQGQGRGHGRLRPG